MSRRQQRGSGTSAKTAEDAVPNDHMPARGVCHCQLSAAEGRRGR